MFKNCLFVSLPLLAFALPAYAQGVSQYEAETVYNFEGEYIPGQVVRPDGELIQGLRNGKQSSLINIRADFRPETVRSVEEL